MEIYKTILIKEVRIMFKNLFKRNKEQFEFVVPMKGKLLSISEVPDPAFSGKMIGDGFAIDPEDGNVVSPVDGKIEMIFPSKHAIGIKGDNGLEILIHFGLETVSLNGEGFEVLVAENQKVSKGDPILRADINSIRSKVPSLVSPVVITNLNGKEIEFTKKEKVEKGEVIILKIKD